MRSAPSSSNLAELATSSAARAWWGSLIAHLPQDLPQLGGVCSVGFHHRVMATFDDADDAIQLHDQVCEEGRHRRPGRNLPAPTPHIKWRGTALHPVYEVIDRKVITSG